MLTLSLNLNLQDLLETQMGMSLPEMRTFRQADPFTRDTQALPGAHLPSKGFWLVKRPTGPSTAAAPSTPGRLMGKVPFKSPSRASALQRTSNGL